MNIDTNIFFDDKVATGGDTLRKKPSSPTIVTQKQRLFMYYKTGLFYYIGYSCRVSLQRQLEER